MICPHDLGFIRRHTAKQEKDKPFFLYLAHTMPHVPINASKDFLGKSKRGLYGDVVEELDWSLGQILAELKKLNLDDNTLVVFTSDNGPWIEGHLKGKGGLRVPAVIRWPGKIKAGRESDDVVSSMDLFPTFASLADASLPKELTIDGVDQVDFLLGQSEKSARDHFFYYAGSHLHGVRWNDWKLVCKRKAKPKHLGWWSRMITEVPETTLYDLKEDIGETTNVAAQHPEVVAKMEALLKTAREELGDWNQLGKGARFFDEELPLTAKEKLQKRQQQRKGK